MTRSGHAACQTENSVSHRESAHQSHPYAHDLYVKDNGRGVIAGPEHRKAEEILAVRRTRPSVGILVGLVAAGPGYTHEWLAGRTHEF